MGVTIGYASTKFLGQVFGPEVRIALQHLQRFVAGDRSHFHDIEAALEEPGSGLVAQIVKAEALEEVRIWLLLRFLAFQGVGDMSPCTDSIKCFGDRVCGDTPDLAVEPARRRPQDFHRHMMIAVPSEVLLFSSREPGVRKS